MTVEASSNSSRKVSSSSIPADKTCRCRRRHAGARVALSDGSARRSRSLLRPRGGMGLQSEGALTRAHRWLARPREATSLGSPATAGVPLCQRARTCQSRHYLVPRSRRTCIYPLTAVSPPPAAPLFSLIEAAAGSGGSQGWPTSPVRACHRVTLGGRGASSRRYADVRSQRTALESPSMVVQRLRFKEASSMDSRMDMLIGFAMDRVAAVFRRALPRGA